MEAGQDLAACVMQVHYSVRGQIAGLRVLIVGVQTERNIVL